MATPVLWQSAFAVNTGTAAGADVEDPRIIGLSNGNFLVAWEENGAAGVDTTNGTDIIGKIFDAEGNLVRDSYRINSTRTADNEGDFDIAATNDGGFVLVYVDNDGANSAVIWERKNAAGNNTNSRVVASETGGDGDFDNPQVAFDENSSTSFVTYTDLDVGGFLNPDDDDVRGVRLSSSGTVLTSEADFGQNNGDDEDQNAVAINTNGEFVSAYRDEGELKIDVRSIGGALLHTVVVDDNGSPNNPSVATLSNGFIAVTWVDDSDDVNYAVYNSNLGTILGKTQINGTEATEPEIVALPQGGFVIVWDDNSSGDFVFARQHTNTGVIDGSVITIDTGVANEPDIGVTGDGRILFTWDEGTTIRSSIYDSRGSTINASIYDSTGRQFVDTDVITGRQAGTTINGDGDADTILGQGGNDVIDGGNGSDSIEGGAGNDVIRGGLGFDTIDAGSGSDTIILEAGANIDSITGGSGEDRLDASEITAASGAITVTNTTLTGLGGSRGLSSVENVIGTQVNDTVNVTSSIFDTIDGQGGNDTITTDSGVQTLIGGAGNDTLSGGLGTDSIIAGVGDDTILLTAGDNVDRINGGSGQDTLDASDIVSTSGAITVTDTTLDGLGAAQSLVSIENVIGTQVDDTITLTGSGVDTIDGQGGNDIITTGSGVQTIFGGAGNDTIEAGTSTDIVDAGAGDDVIVLTAGGNIDSIAGGSGSDTLDGSAITAASGALTITATSLDGLGAAQSISSIETYIGSQVGDTISSGNVANVTIDGQGGNDTINGGGSRQSIDGGAGDDTIDGGFAVGSGIGDDINGGMGNDRILGANGGDTIDGGDGNDTINANGGNDTIQGGTGNDLITGGSGADSINGGIGVDTVSYTTATGDVRADLSGGIAGIGDGAGDTFLSVENLIGSGFDDDLRGNAVANTLQGGSGNDALTGNEGDDRLDGGVGDDRLSGGAGEDFLIGGAGTDRVLYLNSGPGLVVDILNTAGNTGDAEGDTFSSIEDIFGSNNRDIMRGNDVDNLISGRGGNDLLLGRGGDDQLFGSAGDDLLLGASGNDTMIGGSGFDIMRGGTGADIHNGGAGIDRADYIDVGGAVGVTADLDNAAANTNAAAGDTYISIENLYGTNQVDNLRGNDLNNVLAGNGGNDVLRGRDGVDLLVGGAGNDVLIGGGALDRLVGGAGADSFRFESPAQGVDRVIDFQANVDTVVLNDIGFTSLTPGALSASNFRSGNVALDADDYIIYNSATGRLFYDADGSGAGGRELVAIFLNNAVLDADDFAVI